MTSKVLPVFNVAVSLVSISSRVNVENNNFLVLSVVCVFMALSLFPNV